MRGTSFKGFVFKTGKQLDRDFFKTILKVVRGNLNGSSSWSSKINKMNCDNVLFLFIYVGKHSG